MAKNEERALKSNLGYFRDRDACVALNRFLLQNKIYLKTLKLTLIQKKKIFKSNHFVNEKKSCKF